MQPGDGAKVYAEHGSFDQPAYGYGTRGRGLGTKEDLAAGRRNPADAERKGVTK